VELNAQAQESFAWILLHGLIFGRLDEATTPTDLILRSALQRASRRMAVRRNSLHVVPAQAGTHTLRRKLSCRAVCRLSLNNNDLWLWAPACAGATQGVANSARRANHPVSCQGRKSKYFSLPEFRFTVSTMPSRAHGGTFRDRHDTQGAGCDGRCERQVIFTGRKRWQRTAKSCGPGAATLASSYVGESPRGDGGKRGRSPGRARRKP
jgi:hypothetical protein